MMIQSFHDRRDAGRRLASALRSYADVPDVIVLAIPRGGVPVAYEVAAALHAPLDVFVVRKVGVPGHEEFAMGAIASGGVRVINDELVRRLGLPAAAIEALVDRERRELERRERLYRGGKPKQSLHGKTVLLVDDGLATGSSMEVAVEALRRLDPKRVVVAVPTAPAEACARFRRIADDCVCATTPEPFHAVGLSYEDFTQTTDEEVEELLRDAERRGAAEGGRRGG